MITLLNATNRPDNRTSIVSKTYEQFLININIPFQSISLEDIDGNLILDQSIGIKHNEFEKIVDKYIVNAQKIMIIAPEYNGSIPGVLKLFIDALPHKALENKKIALTGVATGRGGNLRGIDHLTGILHYLNANVMPYKLPISLILQHIQENKIVSEPLLNDIQKQIKLFISY
ncbi:MAG: NAD(P)H-dependent oxidoreductase [Bacteroidia bacterium]|nr:NAD(P)H-dependent oxidoreductase [Bacteroidia bacterium]MCZ2249821.1 NAD(P)H-dependent oxidoreductase [Bacteroidia bacterium]